MDARKPDEYHRILDIMIGEVINLRIGGDQRRPILESDANRKRIGLRRFVNGNTREQLAAKLQRRRSIGSALLHVGQRESNLSHSVEIHLIPRHCTAF